MMILGPVTFLDCVIFCIFLTPSLIIDVGLFTTIWTVIKALPFLLIKLPVNFLLEHFLLSRRRQSPFVRRASLFEDLVVRCVRYAFANIPPRIGRVFFSECLARYFLTWRMVRHTRRYAENGRPYRKKYYEHRDANIRGWWGIKKRDEQPDIVIYYAHGGGFSMGSAAFYLEFLLSWQALLAEAGYKNPAFFAVDYTLVPDAAFPTQLHELVHGYNHAVSMAGGDASRVCVSGDSAGATLILSLLLHLADPDVATKQQAISGLSRQLEKPGMAVLISPWPTLVSSQYKNTSSDYLDAKMLQTYSAQYAGTESALTNPLASPGSCKDVTWWKKACPAGGIFVTYGQEEVFAPEIRDFVKLLEGAGILVGAEAEVGGIHAWPVASLFLSSTNKKRLKGLLSIVTKVKEAMQW